MAKRRMNLERMAEQARAWKVECEARIHGLEDELKAANAEWERACKVVENLQPQLPFAPTGEPTDAQVAAIASGDLGAMQQADEAAAPVVDELDGSGLSIATAAKLRRLGLVTSQAVWDATGGDLSKLVDLGATEDRIGPREVTAVRKWVDATL